MGFRKVNKEILMFPLLNLRMNLLDQLNIHYPYGSDGKQQKELHGKL
jgi:hypothetical protein